MLGYHVQSLQVQFPELHKLGVVVHASDPSMWEVDEGGSEKFKDVFS